MSRRGQSTFNIFGGGNDQPKNVSSNAFASSSTTNSCNTITDRPTTRLHAPPGGKQQFNIFGGSNYAEPPKRNGRKVAQAAQQQQPKQQPAAPVNSGVAAGVSSRGVSSNAYASASTTNSCNTITDRPSTRLHAPPGGKQQFNIFGGSNYAAPPKRNGRKQYTPAPQAAAAAPKQQPAAPANTGVAAGVSSRGVSSNAYASASTTNSCNTITDRPTTRVHAAPGGKQSFNIFGGCDENTSVRANKITKGGRAKVVAPKAGVAAGVSSRGVSSNAYASASTTNSCNTITDRPSTRVHAPPGGKSSGPLW